MDLAKRIVAVFLILSAIAAAVLLAVTPLIHDGGEDYPLWRILNFFMAPGVVAALIVGGLRKHKMPSPDGALDRVHVNLAYYGSIVLAMLFFWEWFWSLNTASETGSAATSHVIYFPLMDSLFVVMMISTGRFIWRNADAADD